jgi:hypothetical protein
MKQVDKRKRGGRPARSEDGRRRHRERRGCRDGTGLCTTGGTTTRWRDEERRRREGGEEAGVGRHVRRDPNGEQADGAVSSDVFVCSPRNGEVLLFIDVLVLVLALTRKSTPELK